MVSRHQLTTDLRRVQKSMPFDELPLEIRNRNYEETIPLGSPDNALIVAARSTDALTTKAVQLAITCLSKQTRAESLGIFYCRSVFAAYVEETNFSALIDWAPAVTSNDESLPAITVNVYLMDSIACKFSIPDLIQGWTQLPSFSHEKIHLKLLKGPSHQSWWDVSLDHRTLIAAAIGPAWRIAEKGIRGESRIVQHCKRLFEEHDVKLVGRDGLETGKISDWQWKHVGGRRC